MKSQITTLALASVLTVGLSSLIPEAASAAGSIFLCESIDGEPVTVGYSPDLPNPVEIVRWQHSIWFETAPDTHKHYFSPERRCQDVAERLQTYYACGFLNTSSGTMSDFASSFGVDLFPAPWNSELYPYVYVAVSPVDPEGGPDFCASLRPENGKLLLFMLEPEADTSDIVTQLEAIRRGIGEPIISGSGTSVN